MIRSRARPLKTSCQGLECGFGGKAACRRVVPWLLLGARLLPRGAVAAPGSQAWPEACSASALGGAERTGESGTASGRNSPPSPLPSAAALAEQPSGIEGRPGSGSWDLGPFAAVLARGHTSPPEAKRETVRD